MPPQVPPLHRPRSKLDVNAIWTAVAFVLIIEGLLPFVSPSIWRNLISQILRMQDGQIRILALVPLLAGTALLLVVW